MKGSWIYIQRLIVDIVSSIPEIQDLETSAGNMKIGKMISSYKQQVQPVIHMD